MITWNQLKVKAQRLAKNDNVGVLTQLEQDMNTGYHLFNAKFSRYYARKQQFADLVAGQSIYQTPVDCIRVMGMTVSVSESFQPTVKEINNEYRWRQIVSVTTASNWPVWYYMLGNDAFQLYPAPAESVENGLRFYYQQQDYDLSVNDISDVTSGATITVANGSTLVTASSAIFTAQMKGLFIRLTGVTNLTWYEIVDVPSSSTLTLKSKFIGTSGAGQAWIMGQLSILPEEYQDIPMHYALGLFFSANGNEERGAYHKGVYTQAVKDAITEYSSSNESNVITDDYDNSMNPWFFPPVPG